MLIQGQPLANEHQGSDALNANAAGATPVIVNAIQHLHFWNKVCQVIHIDFSK